MTTRRLVSSLAAALLCAAAGVTLPAPASAASGYCARGTGATVVVDRGSLGGGTSIGCDPAGANTSGSTVVPRAGFPLTYVARQPGFVCRVAGLPDASRESCGNTPPADAYWGLFWSDGKSGSWSYSSVGIGSLKVPAGGFVGWRFQDGGGRANPGTAPSAPGAEGPSVTPKPSVTASPTRRPTRTATPVRTLTPTKAPTTARTPVPTRSGTSPKKAAPTATPSKRAASATATPTKESAPAPAPRSATPSAAAYPSASRTPSGSPSAGDVNLTAGEQARGSSGPGLPIVAGGLLVALAAAAGTLAWRRRGV
ncbi:MAG: hypothetical protein ABIQ59_13900 [Nocardioidaceae bacterium]